MIRRALATMLVGALLGWACLVVLYARSPGVAFEMDRDKPPEVSEFWRVAGFWPAERNGKQTFVWTSRRADFTLAGVDRRVAWSCTLRFRGARPDPAMPQPDLEAAFDGVTAAVQRATNEFQQIVVTAPARPLERGLTLSLVSSTTFMPGPSDRRQLGVQMDLLACRPTGGWVLPPGRAMSRAALAGGAIGAAIGLTVATAGTALAATALVAVGQGVALSIGMAPYSAYPITLAWLAIWIAGLMVVVAGLLEAWARQPLRNSARFVVAFSAVVLYLQLIGLFHPSKLPEDVMFHAHRLERILGGWFYWPQPMPNGTKFPYAIALYVFAAPWSLLTNGTEGAHIALVRIVACATGVLAAASLYLMVVRTWSDRLTGALSVALLSLIPVTYGVLGNANLANAFGQSAAIATVAALTIWPLGRGHTGRLVGLALLAALAFLSHIGTFTILIAMLLAVACFYFWLGGPAMRAPARAALIATAIAVVLAVVLFYGHFLDMYRELGRGAQAGASGAGGGGSPFTARAVLALKQIVDSFGWPILILAVVGAWRLWAGGARDRLGLVVIAWGAVCLAFIVQGLVTPVDVRFERYSDEFLGRVDYATAPAVAILAARGAAWGWRAGTAARLVSGVLLLGALLAGAHEWLGWIR
jgi:hypothetical protein